MNQEKPPENKTLEVTCEDKNLQMAWMWLIDNETAADTEKMSVFRILSKKRTDNWRKKRQKN